MKFERQSLVRTVKVSVIVSLLLMSFLAGYIFASPSFTAPDIYLDSLPSTASYVIDTDGTYIWAVRYDGKIACNGTDASTVIQAAIDALSTSGGKVIIKSGIYEINQSILVNTDSITIEGESFGEYQWGENLIELGVILRATQSLNGGIIIANPTESMNEGKSIYIVIAIRNLIFDGNNKINTDGLVLHLPRYATVSNIVNARCRDGLVIYGGGRCRFDAILSNFNTNYALRVERSQITDNAAFEFTFNKSFFIASYIGAYINFANMNGGVGKFTFNDCHFESNKRQGAYFRNMLYLNMYNCLFEENNQDLDGNTAGLDYAPNVGYGVSRIYLHDTRFIETKVVWGVKIGYTTYGSIENCYIDSGTTSLGFYNSNNFLLKNNVFMKSIMLHTCNKFNLIANTKVGNWTFTAVTNISFKGNYDYITESSGTATISASTSVVFAHGLVGTPTHVAVGFKTTGYGSWIWSADATNITITVAVSGTYDLTWDAEYTP